MKRRDFLKDAALLAAAAAAAPSLASACVGNKEAGAEAPAGDIAGHFRFRSDGSFTVLQFTDTHYISGDPRSRRALDCVNEALDAVKPDLVIHTGDILFGRPDIASAREILQPLAARGIPFAVALGNHDSQFGSRREEVFQAIRDIPGCLNRAPKEGVYGCSNDVITLSGARGMERVFYLFDSMDAVTLKWEEKKHCYDYIRQSQIAWYRAHSAQFAADNGGVPVPALAFFHIPLCEIKEALASGAQPVGNNYEPPCPSRLNSGLYAQFVEMQDVEAVVTGHDHDDDYVLPYGPLHFIYGRYSGCDTVYNHLGRNGWTEDEKISGTRIFRFHEGKSGFETWVRLQGGEEQQKLSLHTL